MSQPWEKIDSIVCSFNSKQSPVKPLVCPGHTQSVHEVYITEETPDGIFMVSACQDRTAMLRDGRTGDWIGTFSGHSGAVWSAHLDVVATRAATGSADFTARFWDATTGCELHQWSHPHVVKSVKIGGHKLLTGGYEKCLRLIDLAAPNAEHDVFSKTDDVIKTTAWTKDSKYIFSASPKEKAVRVWDAHNKQQISTIHLPGQPMSLELQEKDSLLLTIATKEQNAVMVYDVGKSMSEPVITHHFDLQDINVTSASLHPDFANLPTPIFAIGESGNYHGPKRGDKAPQKQGEEAETNWVRIFKMEDGEAQLHFKGHHGPLSSVCWFPDGNSIVSGSDDGTVRLYHPDLTAKCDDSPTPGGSNAVFDPIPFFTLPSRISSPTAAAAATPTLSCLNSDTPTSVLSPPCLPRLSSPFNKTKRPAGPIEGSIGFDRRSGAGTNSNDEFGILRGESPTCTTGIKLFASNTSPQKFPAGATYTPKRFSHGDARFPNMDIKTFSRSYDRPQANREPLKQLYGAHTTPNKYSSYKDSGAVTDGCTSFTRDNKHGVDNYNCNRHIRGKGGKAKGHHFFASRAQSHGAVPCAYSAHTKSNRFHMSFERDPRDDPDLNDNWRSQETPNHVSPSSFVSKFNEHNSTSYYHDLSAHAMPTCYDPTVSGNRAHIRRADTMVSDEPGNVNVVAGNVNGNDGKMCRNRSALINTPLRNQSMHEDDEAAWHSCDSPNTSPSSISVNNTNGNINFKKNNSDNSTKSERFANPIKIVRNLASRRFNPRDKKAGSIVTVQPRYQTEKHVDFHTRDNANVDDFDGDRINSRGIVSGESTSNQNLLFDDRNFDGGSAPANRVQTVCKQGNQFLNKVKNKISPGASPRAPGGVSPGGFSPRGIHNMQQLNGADTSGGGNTQKNRSGSTITSNNSMEVLVDYVIDSPNLVPPSNWDKLPSKNIDLNFKSKMFAPLTNPDGTSPVAVHTQSGWVFQGVHDSSPNNNPNPAKCWPTSPAKRDQRGEKGQSKSVKHSAKVKQFMSDVNKSPMLTRPFHDIFDDSANSPTSMADDGYTVMKKKPFTWSDPTTVPTRAIAPSPSPRKAHSMWSKFSTDAVSSSSDPDAPKYFGFGTSSPSRSVSHAATSSKSTPRTLDRLPAPHQIFHSY